MSKRGKSEKDLMNLRREIDILKKLKHENIIMMLDAFETKREFCVVTEVIILFHYFQFYFSLHRENFLKYLKMTNHYLKAKYERSDSNLFGHCIICTQIELFIGT